jgi:hypothetical protein
LHGGRRSPDLRSGGGIPHGAGSKLKGVAPPREMQDLFKPRHT